MTFAELTIISINCISLLLPKHKVRLALTVIATAIVAQQVFAGSDRWQMFPMYVFTLLLFISFLVKKNRKVGNKLRSIIKSGLVFIWLLLSLIPYLFPLFDLPSPTGRHLVGTQTWSFADSSRQEIYTPQQEDIRKYTAQVWYPSVGEIEGSTPRNTYMPNAKTESVVFGNLTGLPKFFLSHLLLIKTNSFVDAPLNNNLGKLPIIFFSHGHAFYASARQNTSLMEELASHGYVVISLNHAYECMVTTFPENDQKILLDIDLVDKIQKSVIRGPKRDSLVRAIVNGDSDEANVSYNELVKYNGLLARSTEVWSGDISHTINKIMENTPKSSFYSRLDVKKIGIVGMSLGGANAAYSCSRIPEIKAGINMDGFLYGDAYTYGITQPFTFMYSDQNNEMNRFMYRKMYGDNYAMLIKGSDHTDFSEFSFFSKIGSFGQIKPKDCHKIINEYCLSFFDKYLRNLDSIQLGLFEKKYESVVLQKIEISTHE